MDFSALIKKSFSIAWKSKILWLFGFLSGGVGSAGVGNPSGFNFTIPSFDTGPVKLEETKTNELILGAQDHFGSISSQTWLVLIVAIAIVVLVLLLIGIFITNWAGSALVFSILQRNSQRPTFGAGARAGWKYWWKFYLLALILFLVPIPVFLLLALPVTILFLAGLKPLAIGLLILAIVVFIVFIILFLVVAAVIIALSQRMIIHRGVGVVESIRLSGGLLKKHKGDSLLTYLVAIGLNFAVGFILIFVFLPLIIVFGVLVFLKLWWLMIVIAIPVALFLFTAGGFWQAFNAAYWTLFYEHLASKEGW